MNKKTAKHLDVRKGHKSSAIVPGAYSSLSDHELIRDFIQWWAQYQRCLIWHSWQCESGRESPGGLVFFIFTYSQEPSVYMKKLFWVFFWETSPAAWSSSFHLKEEKSRLISCESHRVSSTASVLSEMKIRWHLHQNNSSAPEKCQRTFKTCMGLTCSRCPLAVQGTFPHLLFLLLLSLSPWENKWVLPASNHSIILITLKV